MKGIQDMGTEVIEIGIVSTEPSQIILQSWRRAEKEIYQEFEKAKNELSKCVGNAWTLYRAGNLILNINKEIKKTIRSIEKILDSGLNSIDCISNRLASRRHLYAKIHFKIATENYKRSCEIIEIKENSYNHALPKIKMEQNLSILKDAIEKFSNSMYLIGNQNNHPKFKY